MTPPPLPENCATCHDGQTLSPGWRCTICGFTKPEDPAPITASPCVICGKAITETDSYGVGTYGALTGVGPRYHWSCIRDAAATVSPPTVPKAVADNLAHWLEQAMSWGENGIETMPEGEQDEMDKTIAMYRRGYPYIPSDLEKLGVEVLEWAQATFPGQLPSSVASHLHDEAGELMEEPGNNEEMADCFLLLIQLAALHGYDILHEARKKFEVNRARKWGTPDARGVVKHIEEPRP